MKFGILTGGGDCPGMNAFVRAVVRTSLNLKPSTSVWGIIDGWVGLRDNNYKKLSKRDTAGIAQTGGTVLGTVRLPKLKDDRDMQEAMALNLHDNYFDYIFVIGGNGSLAAANVLNNIINERGYRTKILVAAGSIDNDVCNRYGFSIGFYSAIEKSLKMLEWIRDTATAHSRVYIIKSMGRDSGYLSFFAGIATGAEYVILPNEEVDCNYLANLVGERDRDSRIIVAEGYKGSVDLIRVKLEQEFKNRNINHEIRTVDMGYFQRGGVAEVKDILLASWIGYKMANHALDGGESSFFICYNSGQKPNVLSLEDAVQDSLTNDMSINQEHLDFSKALM